MTFMSLSYVMRRAQQKSRARSPAQPPYTITGLRAACKASSEQVAPAAGRAQARLFAPPLRDLCVVAREQDLGHVDPAEGRPAG